MLVTLRSEGCSVFNKNGCESYGAFKVKTVATTAAGDSFIGGFITAFAEGRMCNAIGFAQAAAAIAVTKRGAQESVPSRAEAECFIVRMQEIT